jgi:16S rRNA (cytidine1402-2'-O)-methyltransferase
MMGVLYVCGTPIGNLEDVSIRLLKTLRLVDFIACEDTRHTLKLLNKYKIKKRLVSYHQFSQESKEDYIIEQLLTGKNIALVSDAGMPGICDPGTTLIGKAIKYNIPIEIIPGPSAGIAALAISGLDTSSFIFEGFLPRQSSKRAEKLNCIVNEERTIIFYETPHRLLQALEDIKNILGENRQIVIAKEISKIHQEIFRGSAAQIFNTFKNKIPRGEFCILIEGKVKEAARASIEQIIEEVDLLIETGMGKKDALKAKAKEYKIPKAELYHLYIQQNQKE